MKSFGITKYICLMMWVAVTGSACSDMLNIPPDGRTSLDKIFSTKDGVQGYLNSCYDYWADPTLGGSKNRASISDEAQDAQYTNNDYPYNHWYTGAITARSYGAWAVDNNFPWGNLYQGIRNCNVFLQRVRGVSVEAIDSSQEEVAGWVAQARALRALYYLQLIKRYGGVPLVMDEYGINHDYARDTRCSFGEVVKFIISDCDAALAAPDTEKGFHWSTTSDKQYLMMTPAVVYAIRSQALTYAVSPLWADGTFTAAEATTVTGEALAQCLTHDYKLFDKTPAPDVAQNPYAWYFFTNPDDLRAVDKETIWAGTKKRVEIWKVAGLPTTPGVITAGPCPTQELVDSYEMANGEPPITGYSDDEHLHPIINAASGYDPANPYAGRDPRFYASVYYNGADRFLGQNSDVKLSQTLTANANQMTIAEADGGWDITTTGGDPYVYMSPLSADLDGSARVSLVFEYKSAVELAGLQIFFGPAIAEATSIRPGNVPPSAEWKEHSISLDEGIAKYGGWGKKGEFLRFDFGSTSGVNFQIRGIAVRAVVQSRKIETFAGGAEGIDDKNVRNTKTGYYLRKFNNNKSGQNNSADGWMRMFRLAELYLNFAETACQSHGPDVAVELGAGVKMSARDAVNAVRRRAGMPDLPEGLSKVEFEKRYRNERRVELAFEEHRYFDLRRWNIIASTDKFVTGVKITKTGEGYTYDRFSFPRACWTPKYLRYALPQDEVDKMLRYTGENWQNPGW